VGFGWVWLGTVCCCCVVRLFVALQCTRGHPAHWGNGGAGTAAEGWQERGGQAPAVCRWGEGVADVM
jgi:hypothetical protein